MADFGILLVAPTHLTKSLKDSLEKHGKLDKTTKIRPVNTEDDLQGIRLRYDDERKSCIGKVIIPTTMRWAPDGSDPLLLSARSFVFSQIDLFHMADAAKIILALRSAVAPATITAATPKSPLARVTSNWLSSLSVFSSLHSQLSTLLATSNYGYTIYPPMLLLPNSQPWPTILAIAQAPQLETLYARLCSTTKVTHIALNGPIPLHSPSEPMDMLPYASITSAAPTRYREWYQKDLEGSEPIEESACATIIPVKDMLQGCLNPHPQPEPETCAPATMTTTNVFRSPTALTPLYGEFGPVLSPTHKPTRQDMDEAFWCGGQQNGIYQIWAPRYTMFSRGNITEKARILKMPVAVRKAVVSDEKGEGYVEAEPGWSAVDLYAGIGYFAFSYVQRGAAIVLCWEINPWSVEGLRRGAKANHWPDPTVYDSNGVDNGAREGKLVVYAEDNRFAPERIGQWRPLMPPVRHVNCGFLPSSAGSWGTAVRVLDPVDGGWVHVHENIAVKNIGERAQEIVLLIKSFVANTPRDLPQQWTLECQHIERVKSYAPGVMHCVLDIYIAPRNSNLMPPAAP